MLAQTLSASLLGVEGLPVRVEVDVAFGLPSLTIVGLAGSQVQEARERVRSALRNSGFELPSRRITVNLAPADVPKDGTAYDVAIAVGILAASGQLPDLRRLESTALLGELALDGSVRPVNGVLSLVAAAQAAGIGERDGGRGRRSRGGLRGRHRRAAGSEAGRCGRAPGRRSGAGPRGCRRRCRRGSRPKACRTWATSSARPQPGARWRSRWRGATTWRSAVRRGSGKTLLLRCAEGLQPPLEDAEAIEVSRIYSAAGPDRPAAAADPAATVSRAAPHRVDPGPGRRWAAGAARRGVPGASGHPLPGRGARVPDRRAGRAAAANRSRGGDHRPGRGALMLPARFTLLMAFNPCPCGWLTSTSPSVPLR